MTENEHVIIAVNDREVSSEAPERLDDNRGRNRKRSKSRSRSSSVNISKTCELGGENKIFVLSDFIWKVGTKAFWIAGMNFFITIFDYQNNN